jgi:hypothetical protein
MGKTNLDQNKWDFAVSCIDPEILALYASPEPDNQELLELRDRLAAKIHNAIKTHLTQRQREVMTLYFFHGRTQQEIADMLGCHQTTVFITIHGTTNYKFNPPHIQGGSIPKIRKYLLADPEVADILRQIGDING